MKKLTLVHLYVLLFVSISFVPKTAAQQPVIDLERIQRATVYIMQAQNVGNDLFITCVSSGTIVSRDGLILTNAHSTVSSKMCPGETLLISLSVRLDEAPIAQYRADIAQADEGLDLALLRITRELDGRLIDRSSLSLPFVELADSSQVRLDETITIVGYPGVGNDAITAVRGTVTGFVFEPRSIGFGAAWIKSSAEIPGTMSGGGVYNQSSQLIGIPTTAPVAGQQGVSANCIPLQDTNRDGLVNNADNCIAISTFINALRPSNFAQPLLRAASLSLTISTSTIQSPLLGTIGTPSFKRLFFSSAVNEAGMPSAVINRLPSGSTSLYLFFDYENMTPQTVYELRVTTNGLPNATFSLAPVRWSGGSTGMWYIGSSGQPWPNGVYEFTLFANGVAAPSARLIVGEAPGTDPIFSDIVFGLLNERGQPLGNGFVLPSGNVASAVFIYRNMVNGTNWTAIWYLNGVEFQRVSDIWNAGSSGSQTTSIRQSEGLPPGSYRLELYIEELLSATSDFIIAGAQQGALPQIFTDLHFTSAPSPADALTAPPVSTFANTISTIYALFDWQQIAPGTLWTLRWLVDGDIFYERTLPWNNAQSGNDFLLQLSNPTAISDGTYSIELRVNNVLLAQTRAQVGIGQLPINQFARASGVQLRGQILDSQTRKGVAGVTVIIISEQFSVGEFIWDQSQVFALATTDISGYFQLDRLLEYSTDSREVAYSVLIAASGYLPISADGIEVTDATINPLNLTIYLSPD